MSKEFVLAGKMGQGWGGVAGHIVSFVWKQSEMNGIALLLFCPGTHEIGPQLAQSGGSLIGLLS